MKYEDPFPDSEGASRCTQSILTLGEISLPSKLGKSRVAAIAASADNHSLLGKGMQQPQHQ